MQRVVLVLAILVGAAALAVAAHLAVIEVGREVVTLRTRRPDGSLWKTRLWVVDEGGSTWLHSAGVAWAKRFEGDPVVELERHGEIRRYRAHAVPGPHPKIDEALRAKYGFSDRWVRLLAPDNDRVLVVRLDPLGAEESD